jgi:hypothetical protein
MEEPRTILNSMTRIRTIGVLDNTRGFLITDRHLSQRKPNMVGAICGFVGGHGGDVYYVAHLGDPAMAVYGWWEFELEPAKDPCPECKGTGIDWDTSHKTSKCTPCSNCHGTAEKPA